MSISLTSEATTLYNLIIQNTGKLANVTMCESILERREAYFCCGGLAHGRRRRPDQSGHVQSGYKKVNIKWMTKVVQASTHFLKL